MITNLQINTELIEKILKEMEQDKILQPYYYFVGENGKDKDNEETNKKTTRTI